MDIIYCCNPAGRGLYQWPPKPATPAPMTIGDRLEVPLQGRNAVLGALQIISVIYTPMTCPNLLIKVSNSVYIHVQ